jgi:hypothetical protein
VHHHHSDYVDVVSAKGPARLSGAWKVAFFVMMIVGFGAFIYQAFLNSDQPRIGWIAFLHNLYFFTGISAAGVVIAAIIHVSRAYWGRPVKRFAEAYGAFLPVSVIGVVVLYFGADHLYEWVTAPPETGNKAFWLEKNFWFGRLLGYLVVLNLLAYAFRRHSLRPDLGLAHEKNPDAWPQPANWKGLEEEVHQSHEKQFRIGVLYCFAFAICVSMLAFELIMSLDYRWFSTMFGGWHFASYILLGWGTLVWVTHWMSMRFGLEKYMHKKLYHDLGKLTFGFTIVWAYLFFAQLMVIWYGNLPHESGWMITRYREPWQIFTLISFFMVFVLPFILGLSKNLKLSPKTFGPVVLISFVGLWIERLTQIAPSCWYFDRRTGVFESGITELVITSALVFLGFLGLFALLYTRALDKTPVMVIADPRLDDGINRH